MRVRKFWRSQSKGFTTCSYIPPCSQSKDSRIHLWLWQGCGWEKNHCKMHSEHSPLGRPTLQGKRLYQILIPAEEEHFAHSHPLYTSCLILRVKETTIGKTFVRATAQSHKLSKKLRFSHRIIEFFFSPTSDHRPSGDSEYSGL